MGIERKLERVISGEAKGLGAMAMRGALGSLSNIYASVMERRNNYYDKNTKQQSIVYTPSVPVISVGNITAGGTGKTPFVTYICRYFLKNGMKPAILMRGYKAKNNAQSQVVSDGKKIRLTAEEAGDEAYLLAKSLPGVAVLIGRKRVESAKLATDKYNADILIVDDGFQHRKLGRSLDLVLVDSTKPFGYNKVIPAGLLREPLKGLKRASLIALTKTDQVDEIIIKNIIKKIKQHAPTVPVVTSIHKPKLLQSITQWSGIKDDFEKDIKSVLAVSAIGNPKSFITTLQQKGYEVKAELSFRDHHTYNLADIRTIELMANKNEVDVIAITEKDAVKLGAIIERIPNLEKDIYVLPITIEITSNEDIFDKALAKYIK